jgi:hypothetical protein
MQRKLISVSRAIVELIEFSQCLTLSLYHSVIDGDYAGIVSIPWRALFSVIDLLLEFADLVALVRDGISFDKKLAD